MSVADLILAGGTLSDAQETGVPTVNALLNLVQLAVLVALLKYVRDDHK